MFTRNFDMFKGVDFKNYTDNKEEIIKNIDIDFLRCLIYL
jgi:hypothetical protein